MEHDTMRRKAHKGVDKMIDRAESMNDRGKEAVVTFKERARTINTTIDGYIQRNPKRMVLLAAGAGVLAGACAAAAVMRGKRERAQHMDAKVEP